MRTDDSMHEAIQPRRSPEHSAYGMGGPDVDEAVPSIARERLTTFLGKELRERRWPPVFAILLFLFAVGAAVLSAVNSSLELLFGGCISVLPVALVLWWTRPAPLVIRFTEVGLNFAPSGYFLPYERIQEIFAPQRGASSQFPILLLCEGGHLMISSKLCGDSEELFQFLRSEPLGAQSIPDEIDPAFRDFLRQQVAIHGAEHIVVYRRPVWTERETIKRGWKYNAWVRTALAILAGGAVSLAIFAAFQRQSLGFLLGWGICAFISSPIVLLLGLLPWSRSAINMNKKLRNATLVVSPSGFAMMQGDLKGELRWKEIQNLQYARAYFTANRLDTLRGVFIHVKGATIVIADIYQWPAEHIEWLIRKHSGL